MKTAALLYSGFISILLLTAIIISLTARSSYEDTITTSLDSSLERAISLLQQDKELLNYDSYDFSKGLQGSIDYSNWDSTSDNEQFKQDFVNYLVSGVSSKVTDLYIEFYGADEEHGLLSVKVTAYFYYPTGNIGQVSSYKTMILNKEQKIS
jgi:hypothetical protein